MCKIINKKIFLQQTSEKKLQKGRWEDAKLETGNIAMCIGRGDVIVQCQWGSLALLMRPVVKGKKLLCEIFFPDTLHPPARGEFVSRLGGVGMHMITFLMEHIILCIVSSR